MVRIFGKENCPYTSAAREDYARRDVDVQYIDVKKSREAMEQMLGYSGGHRRVPVIVEDDGSVKIGFGGT
jgi:glutaredoxin